MMRARLRHYKAHSINNIRRVRETLRATKGRSYIMTVKELIEKLLDMPQDSEINLEIIGFRGMEHNCSADSAHIEVYEGMNNRVCIQALE